MNATTLRHQPRIRLALGRESIYEGLGVARTDTRLAWCGVTGDTKLVAFGVSEVCAVVVGVVLGPQTWWAFRCAAAGQCDSVRLIDDRSAAGEEGNHLIVADVVNLFVVGLADEEQRPWFWMGLPASPRTTSLTETLLHSEDGHQRPIEGKRAIEVSDAEEDVREQARSLHLVALATPT